MEGPHTLPTVLPHLLLLPCMGRLTTGVATGPGVPTVADSTATVHPHPSTPGEATMDDTSNYIKKKKTFWLCNNSVEGLKF